MSELRERLASALAERYTIEREIGRGAMATVFLARDPKHDRSVAIKVLRSDFAVQAPERFLREIRLSAHLTHPHILPLYDSGEAEGLLYYVMPFIDGETLRDRLTRVQRLTVEGVLQLGREVADALEHAHRHGVIHRDIKPENILLAEGHAIVADFGVARAIDAAGEVTLTDQGSAVGTPVYMSPEQVAGDSDLDGRTDLYSLGCVLFEALTGQPPFTATTLQSLLLRRLLESAPHLLTLREDAPVALDALIARALARDRAERFASAAEFADALRAVEHNEITPVPGARSPATTTRLPEPVSIAVLPFLNLSSDKENEYFADGMTEELINALVKVPGLRVASRTSAFAFKGKDLGVWDIGQRLKVRHVLEGSVRKAGNRVRITAQLVDAMNDSHLWSDVFDRKMKDVFAIQDEIAHTIAQTLRGQLTTPAPAPATAVERGTSNLEAYDQFLLGRFHTNRRTPQSLHAGADAFRRATELDPGYALAHAGRAECWALLGFDEFSGGVPPREAMPRAKEAALRALQLQPDLAEAHSVLGIVAFIFDWDWATAERELVLAATLKPTAYLALVWYAMLLALFGRDEESMRASVRAQTAEPLLAGAHTMVGRCHYWARRFDEAERVFRVVLEMEPGYVPAYVALGRLYMAIGRQEAALAALERAVELIGRKTPQLTAMIGEVYARMGHVSEALEALEQLRRERSGSHVPVVYDAIIMGGLGQMDDSFKALEQACEERSGWLPVVCRDPAWDPWRVDPRFVALMQRVGFSASYRSTPPSEY